MPRCGGVGFGGADLFAATHSGDAGGPHVPGDLSTSGATRCFPEHAGTLDAVVVVPELAQRRTEDGVAAVSR
jgi:hypothetical protein